MKQFKSRLEQVILKHFSKSSVHGLNNSHIPSKKLDNVKAIHDIYDEEEVFYIYDATLFGSAKDGLVLTEKGIYWREVLGNPQQLDYTELIESTANRNLRAKAIFILDNNVDIEIKEVYYKFICDLRLELVRSAIIYETYYRSALSSAEKSLGRLLKKEHFSEIIEWLKQYEGLFLEPKDKSAIVREISFEAYLKEQMFPKAKEQLEFIEEKDPRFYEKGTKVLELAIKEEQYSNLEARRLKAIEVQDFEEAYTLFEEERALNIRKKDELNQIELDTKEAHFKSLDQIRLKAMEEDEYDDALVILENQKALNIRHELVIKKIKESVIESKKDALAKYLGKLNGLLQEEKFAEAEQLTRWIYKIDPLYSLEREKILLTIYQYDLKKAKEEIAQLIDPNLRLELEGILQTTTKALHEKIRNAARNKKYEMFEKHPDMWNYRDEYGMSVIHYFALEADVEGILKALDHIEIVLMSANIFGHNFIDLIGLACDPNLGGKKENPIEILEKIKHKVDLRHVDDRIKFLETGQERHFFSYKSSQEGRLSELNQKLISLEHFKHIQVEIDNQTNNDVDKIVRHIFSRELEDIDSYPTKDEFETSEAYRRRAKAFRRQYLNRTDFITEYKRQNQPTVVSIDKILKEKRSCFIPRISALVEYKGKELEALRALETQEDVLRFLNLYFPADKEVLIIEVGIYDADKEVFYMEIDGEIEEMPMPLSIAREFKKTFDKMEFIRLRMIKDGKIVLKPVPRYSSGVKGD